MIEWLLQIFLIEKWEVGKLIEQFPFIFVCLALFIPLIFAIQTARRWRMRALQLESKYKALLSKSDAYDQLAEAKQISPNQQQIDTTNPKRGNHC
jgi:hypothetical protein